VLKKECDKDDINELMEKKVNHTLTRVPCFSSRRANGKTPSMISMPLLSTKMKEHL